MRKLAGNALRGFGLAAGVLATACAHGAPGGETAQAALLCETSAVAISTDFEGAGQHGCALSADGPVLTVWPEASIAGPINPSPWYAFQADIRSRAPVSLRLDYAGYEHRYHPWVSRDDGDSWIQLPADAVSVGEEGHIATLTLPAGPGEFLVAGRPLIAPAAMADWAEGLAKRQDMDLVSYGESLDGRDLTALVSGPETAKRLVVAMTGQHPPEQSGVAAFKAFSEAFMGDLPPETRADTRVILLPLVNPDGRARGHWRHNNGGLALNRDWRNPTQPATKAVTAFLSREAQGREAVAFMDFHSTQKTLVYTPPFEENFADMSFPRELKAAFDAGIEPDPEWIAGHNAEAGTSKNWALQMLDVAGLTIELADDAPEAEIASVGELAAQTLLAFLARGPHTSN